MVTVEFNPCGGIKTLPLYQFDYGQQMEFVGFDDLPATFEVHFANEFDGDAITQLAENNVVDIPDMMLTSGYNIYAWIFLHESEEEGATKYFIEIPVMERAEPSDDPPTPVEQSIITQAIAALNAGMEAVEAATELVGDLDDLDTSAKNNVVAAINEVNNKSKAIIIEYNDLIDTAAVSDMEYTAMQLLAAFQNGRSIYLTDSGAATRIPLVQAFRQRSGLMYQYYFTFCGQLNKKLFVTIDFSAISALSTSMTGVIHRWGNDYIGLDSEFDIDGNVTIKIAR